MKRSSRFTNVLFVLLLVTAGLAATAHAVIYTWDVLPGEFVGNGQIDDGAGTWAVADANNWTIDGGVNNIKWADGSDAVFGTGLAGTAGVVTITGAVSTPSVTFNKAFDTNSYSLTGGTLTLTGAATVTTDGATNTINSIIDGTSGLTKEGGGTLTLGGANIYTGLTTVSAGTLALSGTGTLGASGNNLTLAGGSLDMGGASQTVGAVAIQAAGVIGNGGTLNASSMTKSDAGTAQLSALTAVTGATTVTGGTLQYSTALTPSTESIVINGGGIIIDDGVVLTPTGAGGITFSSTNAIGKTGTTGSLGFVTQTSTLTVTADPGITGTISANIGDLATAGAFAGAGNVISKLGSGKLVLAGPVVLVGDVNSNLNAGFTVDGGGELEITGALKAASTLQSNRGNFTNTVGATTANNTLTISGVSGSSVYAGGLAVGGSTFGGNSVVISRPGTQAVPSYKLAANGAQINLGVSSSNNSLTVSNGAYLYTTQGGGTMTWTIGTNAGANNNSILITGVGSTIDRSGGSGSAVNVGAAGDNNSVTISAGGKLKPRRYAIATNGGDNNYTLVTGSGSTLDNNESNSRLTIASAAGSVNNRLVVDDGGFANFINGSAVQCSVGSVTGADNNYIRVDGINSDSTKSSFTLKNPNPLTIGGAITTTPFVDSLASGNHLDVWNGATTSHNSVYVMGVGSAFNLGNGTTVSTPSEATVAASTGNAAYAAGITLYNADSRLNIENGRLIAGADGALVSGPGRVDIKGPAYFSTTYSGS